MYTKNSWVADTTLVELPTRNGVSTTTPETADNADNEASSQVNDTIKCQWGELTPADSVDTGASDDSKLPTSNLWPAKFWRMVTASSVALQAPREMQFMFGLAVLSAAVGGRRTVTVRADWDEQVVVYTATIAAPSERKSPTVRVLAQPLRDFAKKRREDLAEELDETTKSAATASRAAAWAEERKDDDAKELRAEADALEVKLALFPPAAKMFADSITPQKLAVEMAANGGRMAMLLPEGGELFGMVVAAKGQSAAASSANLGIYLKGYTGEPHSEGRITREGVDIERPALSIGVMVQPEVMAALAGESMLRGSGFLARFLYSEPASKVGSRVMEPAAIPDRVRSDYDHAIGQLAGEVFDSDHGTISLAPAAYRKLIVFAGGIEKRLAPGGDLDPIAEWAGKLPGQIVRVAALLELFNNPWAKAVSFQAIEQAVKLAPYFIREAKRVSDVASGRAALRDHPQAVLEAIKRRRFHEITPRLMQRSINKPWVNKDTIRAAIDELEDRNYVRRKYPSIRSGKEANLYEVNPVVCNCKNCQQLSTDCQQAS